MRVGVVTFPGSLDDGDAARAVSVTGGTPERLWHADTDLGGVDAVILPGGFSYGDYLRCGALAHRAPVMRAVEAFAADGGPVLGICNGFQILCEAGLLPGALLRNAGLRFTCRPVRLTVERDDTPWTRGLGAGRELTIPVKNGEGRFHADEATLAGLESRGQVVLRYASGDNPNGSEHDIAGVCNRRGNVVGVMPHPEHAVDPVLIGGTDGRGVFTGLLATAGSGPADPGAAPGRTAEPTAVAGAPRATGPAADRTPDSRRRETQRASSAAPRHGRERAVAFGDGRLRRPGSPAADGAPEGPPAAERLTAGRARGLAGELGLSDDEHDRVVDTLGRVPTVSELGMYSVMWSEHCSYKSSKVHLATLPTDGPQVLVGPGENAGVVDVGDGRAVTFKIESHNHPSYVEPEQGAATGVGGILRDVFTMGARPVALMDPLRFGEPGDPGGADGALQRRLVDGVVRGIGRYGNCVGVANLGGETVFDEAYAANPLVNVLALGVLPQDRLQLARAEQPGDVAVLLGSATGRDGIGGASVLASAGFDDEDDDKRPTVQVGDPFAEKLLIECCLELYERGLVAGIQDMGAAGIACSTAELAASADMGMTVDLDAVPLREPSMESWEILCSESQERMLALVRPEDLEDLREVAARWEVPATVVGEVVAGDELTVRRDGHEVARVPAPSLATEGPSYDRPAARPADRDDVAAVPAEDTGAVRERVDDLADASLRVLSSPGTASSRWVWEQYDRLVRSGTVLGPGQADAGVVRLPDARRAVAVSTDGNGRWCRVDPREGTRRLVAEAHRNVACTGARPLATTNCLNFGSPERPAIMWQFTEAVAGLGEACRRLGVPVTGGNVSFYNETVTADGSPRAIHPTPVVGVVGLLEEASDAVGLALRSPGDLLLRLGAPTAPGLAGSRLRQVLGLPLGGGLAPADLDLEADLAAVLSAAAGRGLLASAHDVSAGGLVTCLAESCLAGGIGVEVTAGGDANDSTAGADGSAVGADPVQRLFSEAPGRVVVSVAPGDRDALERLAAEQGVPVRPLGTVGGDRLRVAGAVDLPLARVRKVTEDALPAAMGESTV